MYWLLFFFKQDVSFPAPRQSSQSPCVPRDMMCVSLIEITYMYVFKLNMCIFLSLSLPLSLSQTHTQWGRTADNSLWIISELLHPSLLFTQPSLLSLSIPPFVSLLFSSPFSLFFVHLMRARGYIMRDKHKRPTYTHSTKLAKVICFSWIQAGLMEQNIFTLALAAGLKYVCHCRNCQVH